MVTQLNVADIQDYKDFINLNNVLDICINHKPSYQDSSPRL